MFYERSLFDPESLPDNFHIVSIPKNQTKGVTLKAMYDPNRAFHSKIAEKTLFQRLEQTGHPLTEMRIGSMKDLLESATNTDIGLLWIRAHGDTNHIKFGENFVANISDLKPVLDSLHKDAIVVLDSCNTGNKKKPCLAQDISNYLCSLGGNPLVIAPSGPAIDIFSFTPLQTTSDSHLFHIGFYNDEGENVTRFFQCSRHPNIDRPDKTQSIDPA